MKKLVGDNFFDFVNDESQASVVMFDHHQCELCNKVRDFMMRVSDDLILKYVGKIKFGVINSGYN